MLSMKAMSVCMLAATASASNLRTTTTAGGSGIVMVDGGSTGSKLASYHGDKKKGNKVLTKCDLDSPEGTPWPLKGVSAYAYEAAVCKQTISGESFCVDPLPNPSTKTWYVKINLIVCVYFDSDDTQRIQFFYHFYFLYI
jgi:hypothetical protein